MSHFHALQHPHCCIREKLTWLQLRTCPEPCPGSPSWPSCHLANAGISLLSVKVLVLDRKNDDFQAPNLIFTGKSQFCARGFENRRVQSEKPQFTVPSSHSLSPSGTRLHTLPWGGCRCPRPRPRPGSPPHTHPTSQSLPSFILFKIRRVKYFSYKFRVERVRVIDSAGTSDPLAPPYMCALLD